MLDCDEAPTRPYVALKREACRVAADAQHTKAGFPVLRSVTVSIAAAMPDAAPEVQPGGTGKPLMVLAQTEFSAARNAMPAVLEHTP
ncbi:MAG TPA: hypothetical protein VGN83_12885 [Falsiroseomonas sp.]|jgi:hypothetical protein|nr:hypothetical protein [Falsiroseomonas sp.]